VRPASSDVVPAASSVDATPSATPHVFVQRRPTAASMTTPQPTDADPGLPPPRRLAIDTTGRDHVRTTDGVPAQRAAGMAAAAAISREHARDEARAAIAVREQPERAGGAAAMPLRPVVSRATGSTRVPGRPWSDGDSRAVEAAPRAATIAVGRLASVAPPPQLVWRRAADGADYSARSVRGASGSTASDAAGEAARRGFGGDLTRAGSLTNGAPDALAASVATQTNAPAGGEAIDLDRIVDEVTRRIVEEGLIQRERRGGS